MALSEAKKRANARWDKKNMASLACRVKLDTANAFRDLCSSRGTTVSKAISTFIKSEIAAAQQAHPVGDCAARCGAGEARE